MHSPAPDSIEAICARFRAEWTRSDNTQISNQLTRVSEELQLPLLTALIAIELEYRTRDGEEPFADDYAELGPDAVAIAKLLLEQSLTLSSLEDDSTVFIASDEHDAIDQTRRLDGITTEEDLLFDDASDASSSSKNPKRIGRYRLLHRIGMGGMGAVWKAEQDEPVKRFVALKVIRADLGATATSDAAKSAVARFEAERQAIALMNHQNIAKIFDAGTTDSGHPYFVMELVNGIPFNEYCDRNRLGIRERLQLMIPVCQAVQHAHQKAIIHRDLKHSNVLVADYDGQPVPKVIDFGLAKALDQRMSLTDKTMFTEVGNVVGTLQYMSPEQAETNNLDIDTRSDVYSLGVMIYKLLVGSTPLESVSKVRISPLEALKFIREKDPSRPSDLISEESDFAQQMGMLRQVQPDKFKQILAGDLDWIVMKALEKDRHDRYDTADALAMDLERYLRDERILARPPSTIYSLRKFVKRNRGLVASVLGLCFLMFAGIVATSTATWWAYQERNRANAQSDLLRIETDNAHAAEQQARASEATRKVELLAMRLNSAWSDWRLGDTESAWVKLNLLSPEEDGWESRFLRSEFSASEHTLHGHSHDVISLDVSNDGRYIATAATDDSLKIWDAKSWQLVHTLLLNDEPTSVRFSLDSKQIACSNRSNQIVFWQVDTGQPLKELGPFHADVTCFEFLPLEDRLVVGFAAKNSVRNGSIRTYEADSPPPLRVVSIVDGTVVQELAGHTADIESISCSPDGQTFASGGQDTNVLVWKKTGDQFDLHYSLANHFREVTCVSVSPTNDLLMSCSADQTIRLWDLETGELFRTLVGHSAAIHSARFSADGERIVSTSADRTARVWNRHGESTLTCQGHFDTIADAQFTIDGEQILTASKDKTVRIWNSREKHSTIVTMAHQGTVWAADFSPDGRMIASASEDGTVAILDSGTGRSLPSDIDHGDSVLSLAFSPDGRYLVTGGTDGRLCIWSTEDFTFIRAMEAHQNFIWDVSFSTDGSKLVTASADWTAKIWETEDWTQTGQLTGHKSELGSARFSLDGSKLITSSDDETVKMWDARSLELLHTFEGHGHGVWRAIFSPSDQKIISSGYDGEIIVWDVANLSIIRRIAAHNNQIAGLTISQDGSRIVSASDDGTIKIWDLASGIELFVLRDAGSFQSVCVSFSDDGNKLVSGNSRGLITVRALIDAAANNRPFLPHDVVGITTRGIQILADPNSAEEDFRRELELSELCCRQYPSYKSYKNLGVAQYRLGMLDEAITSLTEANRLEPIHYGEPDELPHIEAFLAMALYRTEQSERANELRSIFDAKRNDYWLEDERVDAIADEIDQVFSTAP